MFGGVNLLVQHPLCCPPPALQASYPGPLLGGTPSFHSLWVELRSTFSAVKEETREAVSHTRDSFRRIMYACLMNEVFRLQKAPSRSRQTAARRAAKICSLSVLGEWGRAAVAIIAGRPIVYSPGCPIIYSSAQHHRMARMHPSKPERELTPSNDDPPLSPTAGYTAGLREGTGSDGRRGLVCSFLARKCTPPPQPPDFYANALDNLWN